MRFNSALAPDPCSMSVALEFIHAEQEVALRRVRGLREIGAQCQSDEHYRDISGTIL
jgi:hypothetical protein